MRDKGLGIAITFGFVIFVVTLAVTNGFAAPTQELIASSDVVVRTTAPTVNDDLDFNFLKGQIWIDTVGGGVYILEDNADGSAVWTDITAGGSGTYTKSVVIEDPADADNFLFWRAFDAITITDIHCIVDPADLAESVVIDIQERDGTGDNPATVDATITCDNDGAEDDGSLTNGAIDAGDWLSIDIGTVTGTVTEITVTIAYVVTAA